MHAVHIHETGNCSPCSGAKGHFDPGPASKSSPDGNHPFHSGDLVNVEVRDGVGSMYTTTSRITLSPGPLSLFDGDGSAFIIHVDPDTYCPEGEVKGCAGGARAACGIIEKM
jgi:Cu-Zn family superoxide dismutase